MSTVGRLLCAASLVALSAAALPAAEGGARALGKEFSAVAKKASPAVVFIKVEKEVRGMVPGQQFNDPFDLFNDEFFRRFFGERPQYRQQPSPRGQLRPMGQGTGFLISADGHILTNNHVVGDADRISVKLLDEREFTAKLVGKDAHTDLAVIKIEARDLPKLELGDSDALEVGEWILAVGNPFGLAHTITAGIVSAKGRGSMGIVDYENFIQTDAAINPGNSGGPMLNLDGEVVGINSAIFSKSGGYMGIGFAIPVNMAKGVVDQLVKTGTVTRGSLGVMIKDLTPELVEAFGLKDAKGVLVEDVVAGSAAEKAGLKRGDVVVEMDGQPVEKTVPFRNAVAMVKPGTRLALTVLRGGERKAVPVTVGRKTEGDGAAGEEDAADADDLAGRLGFTVKPLDRELAERLGVAEGEGVVVERVDESSSAAAIGLRPGSVILEVNHRRVRNPGEFAEAVARGGERKFALLLVREGRYARYAVLRFAK